MGKLTHTVSGDVAQFRSADKANIESLKLNIAPVQNGSGDPAPDNICPITGHTYVDAFASSKNLWNDEWFKEAGWTLKDSGTYAGYYNGNAYLLMRVHRGSMFKGGIFQRKMNLGRVTISFDLLRPSSGQMRIYFMYDDADGWVNHSGNIASSGHKTYTSTANKNCVAVAFYTSVGISATSFGLKNVQIEISNAETAYEIAKMNRYSFRLPTGKNIFDESSAIWMNGYYISNTGVESTSDNYKCTYYYYPIKPSTTYTFQYNKGTDATLACTVSSYDENKNFIIRDAIHSSTANTGVLSNSFTTASNARFIRFGVPATNSTNIQIEEGDTATAYEPCMPIYGGYVDLVTGEVWRTMELLTVTSASAAEASYGITYLGGIDYITNATNAYCNCLKHSPGAMNENSGTYVFNVYKSSARNKSGVRYRFDGNSPSAGSERVPYYNAQLKALSDAGTPMKVCYELANPVLVTTLTPTQVKTLLDRNSMWNSAGSTEVDYAFTDRLAKRRMLMQKPGGLLPNEYQQVEYIQTDGYACIDTGVYGNNDTSAKYDFQLVDIKDSFIFGTRITASDSAYCIGIRGGVWFATAFDGSGNRDLTVNGTQAVADTSRHLIYQNKKDAYLDGELRTQVSNNTFTTPDTLYLFRSHHHVSSLSTQHKLYSCIIYDDETEIRNFVPCYRKSDNVIGMYDTVNGVFYTNANSTGSFSIPT